MYKLAIYAVLLAALLFSCEKQDDLDDPNVYLWKIELFSTVPPGSTSVDISSTKEYLVNLEYKRLTNREVAEIKKSKKTSGLVTFYRYTKVKE